MSIQTDATMTAKAVVWFDGDCPLCVREISLIRRLDRRGAITFVDLARGEGCPLDRDAMLRRFHAQEPGQPIVSGAEAFAVMWRATPALRPLGLLARQPAILWLLERLYRVFLTVRPRLQVLARRVLH